MRGDDTKLILAVAILVSGALTRTAHAVPQVVVEAKCASGAAYVEGGTGWANSSAKSNRTPCAAGSRSSRDATAYADFIPAIVTEGRYDIFATWGQTTSNNNGPNAENVQVSIIDRDGTRTTSVNMRGYSGCVGANGNQLILVGSGYFVPGQGHKVRISNTASGQCQFGASKRYVSADAVVFAYVDLTPTRPASWGRVKVIYRD